MVVEIRSGLLTKSQAANVLGVSIPTLEKLVRQTDIPCTRVGRKYIFPKELLLDWVMRRSTEKIGIVVEEA